eukprot:GHVH01006820.1.p1 GENE.GHVH01006820.1~~GHVH01006820.1.p1  ORF type:complete len:544 (-),score=74.55 GHVH01006820.1:59-1690(-)
MMNQNAMLNNLPIVLLRDGVEDSQGTGHIITNINACSAIADILKTTLGPRGMDKLITNGRTTTISNDGATIIDHLNIEHPAARMLVDISKAQDEEVGDGTTTVILLASELLSLAKELVEEKMPISDIIKGFRQGEVMAQKSLDKVVEDLSTKSEKEKREAFKRCAVTTLNSKVIGGISIDHFASLATDACFMLGPNVPIENIAVQKVVGGSVEESELVRGVAFEKTFSYAGFELAPKQFTKPKICLLNHELELKAEKDNAEVRITDPSQYRRIIEAEWKIIYDKLDSIMSTGCNIVISKLPIGDLATQYFADRGVFCAGRVDSGDVQRLATASGARVQTSLFGIDSSCLGIVDTFEEKDIGSLRYNYFCCADAKTCTVILRGGATQYIDEVERSFHDALCVIRRCIKTSKVVAGGGAVDLHLSNVIRQHSLETPGKAQLALLSYARSFEVIPRTLAINSGMDATLVLNQLRVKHHRGDEDSSHFGIDCYAKCITNTYDAFVWEPALIKKNAISAATEAACTILQVDETIRHPSNRTPDGPNAQ